MNACVTRTRLLRPSSTIVQIGRAFYTELLGPRLSHFQPSADITTLIRFCMLPNRRRPRPSSPHKHLPCADGWPAIGSTCQTGHRRYRNKLQLQPTWPSTPPQELKEEWQPMHQRNRFLEEEGITGRSTTSSATEKSLLPSRSAHASLNSGRDAPRFEQVVVRTTWPNLNLIVPDTPPYANIPRPHADTNPSSRVQISWKIKIIPHRIASMLTLAIARSFRLRRRPPHPVWSAFTSIRHPPLTD